MALTYIKIFLTSGDEPHSTETTFHFQGFVDNFCKSSQLFLTAAVMAPLTPPGPFNLVTAQTANECFTSAFTRALHHNSGLGEINGISHNVVISTSVSRRAQSRTPHYVTNISWFSSRFLSRTCYSRVKRRSRLELMDLECGMFQKSGLLTLECGRPWLQRWRSGHPEELLWLFCWSQRKREGTRDKSLFI